MFLPTGLVSYESIASKEVNTELLLEATTQQQLVKT